MYTYTHTPYSVSLENLSTSMLLAVVFSQMSLSRGSLLLSLLRFFFFNHEWICILPNAFSESIKMKYLFFNLI